MNPLDLTIWPEKSFLDSMVESLKGLVDTLKNWFKDVTGTRRLLQQTESFKIAMESD